MSNKWLELKEKIKNPPADRLAKIEYRSHFYNMMGVSLVCIILIVKGYWYVILAFIFSLGVSYSQGMTSYKKYQMICAMTSKIPIENEMSPSRKRDRIIKETIGVKARVITSIFAGLAPLFIIPEINRAIYSLSYAFLSIFIFIITYYFPFYWIANYLYNKKTASNLNIATSMTEMKGGDSNGKNNIENNYKETKR